MHGRFHAVFATGIRFIVARSMCGVLDEYRSHGMLVGWSHTVIKGDTLREMWFYQSEIAVERKMYLWHGAIRNAVKRGT